MTNRRRKHPHRWNGVKHVPERRRNGLVIWWAKVRKDGLKVFIRHPHHYVVSFGLSVTMLYIGQHGPMEHLSAWLYAMLENITTALEE